MDRHKKSYLELNQRLPQWWWANESNTGKVHYVQDLGIEEIEPVYLCGYRSENIYSAAGHTEDDRCPKCTQTAQERGLPLEP